MPPAYESPDPIVDAIGVILAAAPAPARDRGPFSELDSETLKLLESIASAGMPDDYPAPVRSIQCRTTRQRARARRSARRPRKASKKSSSDPEPARPRGVLIDADERRAMGLPSSGPRYSYEWRDCEACGREFKNYWANFAPMSSCSACCQTCQDNGDCPRCGADTGADPEAE